MPADAPDTLLHIVSPYFIWIILIYMVCFFTFRAAPALRMSLMISVMTMLILLFCITRIAVIQVARGEKIGLTEALRFAIKRVSSYISAPLFPLLFVFVLLLFMCIFGLLHMIPGLGDIFVSGLFWPVMIAFGIGMAIALVGLVGWPLMPATISAEGTDSWEAVSRSYS